ncbi:MAG: OmpA family protein [Flavobacteriaceae bacterium]|nr:OmpA family protein [Flavobacteriaceae bacterium]
MKKQIYIFITLMLVGAAINAQNANIKKANKLFSLKAFSEAAGLYETEEDLSQEALQNLGDCYYYNAQMKNAAKTYKQLITKYGIIKDKEAQFRYGQALKGVNNYERSDIVLGNYFGESRDTDAFIEELVKNTPHVFKLQDLNSIGINNDFGLSFYGKNKVTFASDRNTEHPIYSWNNKPYLDLYSATLSESGELTNIKPFPSQINTETHESNAVISKDGKTMYFNRTSSKRVKENGLSVANIKIYKAELIDDVWSNIQPLPFTSNEFNTEHPSVSKNGRTMYFASDMPGGYGSFDIYKVPISVDGTFGEPVNLGPNVNTSQREQFPFISEINVLYYSSNGHQGFGGLDVFRSESVNGEFTKALNLGKVVNSNLDDFGYIINEKKNFGYFTSNRSGKDKSYRIAREENILTKYLVNGIVQDKNSKELLPGSLVTLFDDFGNVLQDTIVKDDAYYLFKIEPNKKYKVRGTRKLYIPYDVEFSTDSEGKISHNIYLILESYADAEEKIEEKETGVVQVDLEKIFFDFDKWDIREDAANTLNTLVDLMKKYPEMEVEVSAHTDARGPDEYNLNLSKKRAASTLDYLVSQGIERDRLKSIGYGEMQPLNKCIKEGICTDQEYDINRRCEFTLLN